MEQLRCRIRNFQRQPMRIKESTTNLREAMSRAVLKNCSQPLILTIRFTSSPKSPATNAMMTWATLKTTDGRTSWTDTKRILLNDFTLADAFICGQGLYLRYPKRSTIKSALSASNQISKLYYEWGCGMGAASTVALSFSKNGIVIHFFSDHFL